MYFLICSANLCDSITSGSGKAGTPSQQSSMPIIWNPNTIHFGQQKETVKTEGIKTIAKNVGSE